MSGIKNYVSSLIWGTPVPQAQSGNPKAANGAASAKSGAADGAPKDALEGRQAERDAHQAALKAKLDAAKGLQKPESTGVSAGAPRAESTPAAQASGTDTAKASSTESGTTSATSMGNYRFEKKADGKFRLVSTNGGRAYVITIHPMGELSSANDILMTEAGKILGELLSMIAKEEGNHGGIKSVTFSGDGGSLAYHNHPEGAKSFPFGGRENAMGVEGPQVADALDRLEKLLGKKTLTVSANAEGNSKVSTVDKADPAKGESAADKAKAANTKAKQKADTEGKDPQAASEKN